MGSQLPEVISALYTDARRAGSSATQVVLDRSLAWIKLLFGDTQPSVKLLGTPVGLKFLSLLTKDEVSYYRGPLWSYISAMASDNHKFTRLSFAENLGDVLKAYADTDILTGSFILSVYPRLVIDEYQEVRQLTLEHAPAALAVMLSKYQDDGCLRRFHELLLTLSHDCQVSVRSLTFRVLPQLVSAYLTGPPLESRPQLIQELLLGVGPALLADAEVDVVLECLKSLSELPDHLVPYVLTPLTLPALSAVTSVLADSPWRATCAGIDRLSRLLPRVVTGGRSPEVDTAATNALGAGVKREIWV